MEFLPTALFGVYVIEREPFSDQRGSFSRIFCARELDGAGLNGNIAQISLSTNIKKGTLRGMHSQYGGDAEDKVVSCISGKIFDVCVDVREGSDTFGKWVGATLSDKNNRSLYIPKGFAHGFLTLEDNSDVLYIMSQFYVKGSERSYRYDDPAFNITWPLNPPYILSDKDNSHKYI